MCLCRLLAALHIVLLIKLAPETQACSGTCIAIQSYNLLCHHVLITMCSAPGRVLLLAMQKVYSGNLLGPEEQGTPP